MAKPDRTICMRRRELIRSAGEPDNHIEARAVATEVDELTGEVLSFRLVRQEVRGRSSTGPLACGIEEAEGGGWWWWVDPAPEDDAAREAFGGLKGGVVATRWQALEELPDLVTDAQRWEPGPWLYALDGGRCVERAGAGARPGMQS